MSFFNVYGYEVSPETILEDMISEYTGDATDFTEGSQIMNLFRAFAVLGYDIEDKVNDVLLQVNIDTADGEYLDTIAEQPSINLSRDEGSESNGDVIFTLTSPKGEEFVIPTGTLLVSGDFEFETVNDCVIGAGELEGTAHVESVDIGVEMNIEANTIQLSEASTEYTVTNPYSFIGGSDYEEDEEFRERIKNEASITDFGSVGFYVNRLTNEYGNLMHDVVFRSCECDYTSIVIPNTYLLNGQEVLNQRVQAYLDNPNNIVLGQSFIVQSPSVEVLSVDIIENGSAATNDINIVLTDGYSEENIARITNLLYAYVQGGAVDGFGSAVEFKGLDIGETLDLSEVLEHLKYLDDTVQVVNHNGDVQYQYGLNDNDKYELVI